MKIELKPIIDQLSDAIGLDNHHKVSALIDEDNNELLGWCIVEVFEDCTIEQIDDHIYKDIKELIHAYC